MIPDPPLRLVLDTNTVLALWMFRDPTLARLRECIEAGAFTLLIRADAIRELRQVLSRPRFGLEETIQHALLAGYLSRVTQVPAPSTPSDDLPACRDAEDQKFLEIARDGAAHALLTRDKALLRLARHRMIRERYAILTPEAWQLRHEQL